MSDAGYILDKDPAKETKTIFTGDSLPASGFPSIDSEEWWNWQTDYNNFLSNGWYVLEYDVGNVNQNYLISPNAVLITKPQDKIHFSFTSKMSGNLCSVGNLRFIFNTSTLDGGLEINPVSGDTADGVEFFTYPNVSQGTYVIDIEDEIKWDIYVDGNEYRIYIDGSEIATFTGADGPTVGQLKMMLGWSDCNYAPDQSDLYVKDCTIEYNVTFRDGYNLLNSPDSIVLSNNGTSSFPVSNLYNGIPNLPATFNGENVAITMQADNTTGSGSAFEFTTLAILGHNISERAIIQIKYGHTSAVSNGSEYITWKRDEIIWTSDTKLDYEFVNLEIIDPFNDKGIVIGELLLGTPIYFSECFFWGCDFNAEYNNITHFTDFKAKHTYHLNRIKSVKNIDFKMIEDETVAELYDLFEQADGSRYPVLFFWDTRNEDLGVIYGSLQDKFKNTLSFIDVNEVTKLEIIGLPYAKSIEDDV